MKLNIVKIAAVFGLLATSAVAYAATSDCCGSVECCMRMLACCF